MAFFHDLRLTLNTAIDCLEQELEFAGYKDISLSDENSSHDLSRLSPEGSSARLNVISTAETILRLAKTPTERLIDYHSKIFEMGTLKALIGLGVPYKIPLGGSASYEKLAGEIGISPTLLTRLVRFAMTTGYFAEDGSGHVKHNSMSSVFVRNPQAGGALQWCLNVELKCAMEFQRSLQIDPMGEQRDKTPLGLAYQNHQGRPTMWSLLEKEDSFRSYFYDLMVTQCRAPMYSLNHILRAFDWNQIGTLVDVGGSSGNASFAIAKQYPHLKCIVQDSAQVIKDSNKSPSVLAQAQVEFVEHDFFSPQPTTADAYFLRRILHDWSDADARRILRNLRPVLRTGVRLMVMDTILTEPDSIPLYLEKCTRSLDIGMFTLLAGKERTLEQFVHLVESVEPNLKLESCKTPDGSILSLMTWIYQE